jgi:L,D-transpeptidase catalytic domain
MRISLVLSGIAQAALVGFGTAPRSAHAELATTPAAILSSATVTNAKPVTAGARAPLVEAAINKLSAHVTKTSHPDALRMAVQAYYNYKSAHPAQVRNPYLYFVDYGLDRRTPRGYVFDMDHQSLVEGPFIVAAGRGSSENARGVPTRFSNGSGSGATSLGLFVTKGSYAFSGHSGGRLYHSIGLRLDGVSGRFNDRALARGVVVHGAPYVTSAAAGRSQGCPAMDQARAHRLIPKMANGGLVFLFSPNDAQWMRNDPWANA